MHTLGMAENAGRDNDGPGNDRSDIKTDGFFGLTVKPHTNYLIVHQR